MCSGRPACVCVCRTVSESALRACQLNWRWRMERVHSTAIYTRKLILMDAFKKICEMSMKERFNFGSFLWSKRSERSKINPKHFSEPSFILKNQHMNLSAGIELFSIHYCPAHSVEHSLASSHCASTLSPRHPIGQRYLKWKQRPPPLISLSIGEEYTHTPIYLMPVCLSSSF